VGKKTNWSNTVSHLQNRVGVVEYDRLAAKTRRGYIERFKQMPKVDLREGATRRSIG
jgi:hypothetical protein